LTPIEKIMDPDDRAAFKASRPGLRRFATSRRTTALKPIVASEAEYIRHRSYRDFATGPVSADHLSALLACLRSRQLAGHPKYLYASAGGLYPVQSYLYIKPDRVESIAGGSYYYDPDAHELVQLADSNEKVRDLYDPLINRPVFDKSAFAIYLTAELASIGAMYRERALHYATLEAGHMTQLLEMRAPDSGIGLCQIGGLETADLTELLQLQPTHLVLHGLLGGGLPDTQENASASTQGISDAANERDEGEI
jgi:SagB-type dehydrogenase family enzyme